MGIQSGLSKTGSLALNLHKRSHMPTQDARTILEKTAKELRLRGDGHLSQSGKVIGSQGEQLLQAQELLGNGPTQREKRAIKNLAHGLNNNPKKVRQNLDTYKATMEKIKARERNGSPLFVVRTAADIITGGVSWLARQAAKKII